MATPQHADDWQPVSTRDDFVAMIEVLAQEYEQDEARRRDREAQGLWAGEGEIWAQSSPGAWLDAMAAWLRASTEHPELGPAMDAATEPPSWRGLAFILSQSRRYE